MAQAELADREEPSPELLELFPVSQKVMVKWANSWFEGAVIEQLDRPRKLYRITYKGWSNAYDESVHMELLRKSPTALPVNNEDELSVDWEGQALWAGAWYDVTIISYTWAVAKVHYDGYGLEYDSYFPLSYIQLTDETGKPIPFPEVKPKQTLSNVGKSLAFLIDNKLFSDVTFLCPGDQQLHAHRNILAARCDYFKTMFTTHMSESRQHQVTLEVDVDAALFRTVLEYIYTDFITVEGATAIDLYRVADQYLLEGLKEQCLVAIGRNMTTDNVLSVYMAICQGIGDDSKIKEKCYRFIAKHYKAVTHHSDFPKLKQEAMVELIRNVTTFMSV